MSIPTAPRLRVIEQDTLPGADAIYFPATRVIVVRAGLDEVTRARVIREATEYEPAGAAS